MTDQPEEAGVVEESGEVVAEAPVTAEPPVDEGPVEPIEEEWVPDLSTEEDNEPDDSAELEEPEEAQDSSIYPFAEGEDKHGPDEDAEEEPTTEEEA